VGNKRNFVRAFAVVAAGWSAVVAPTAHAGGVPRAGEAGSSKHGLAARPEARRFAFDGRFIASPGLAFTLSRAVPTLDPVGLRVEANLPRYAPPLAIASAPVFESIRSNNAFDQLLGSGLDHDGVTPLLVVLEDRTNSMVLDVFTVTGIAQADATGVGRVRTVLPPSGDLMRGLVPDKAYRPIAAAVCHGLIVINCTVASHIQPADVWGDSATAMVVSQDLGATWTVQLESERFAPGWRRGLSWTMQNWWPSARSEAPTEAFFAATDYCFNPGAPGGRLLLMRAARASAEEPWVLDTGVVALSSEASEHYHTGGVVPFQGGGLRAFASIGDTRPRNRIVSLTRADHDLAALDGWATQQDFHGAAGSPGIDANQFVGCAPGPDPQSVLAGSDFSSEQILLLSMNDQAPSHPLTRRLFGLERSDGFKNEIFSIRTPTPELGGPYCASYQPAVPGPSPTSLRTLYSADGFFWAQAAQQLSGFPCLHAGHIYFDGARGFALRRIQTPSMVTRRPLLVGPGGLQRTRADPVLSSPSGRVVMLQRDSAGRWTDEGLPLSPQPPAIGPVYRIRSAHADQSTLLGRLLPAGPAPFHDSILGRHLQLRWWIMNPDPSRTARLNVGVGDSSQAPLIYRSSIVSSVRSWIPVVAADFIDLAEGEPPVMNLLAADPVCDDQTVYFALDTVEEGFGFPGYPLPPDDSVPAVGTPCPDELGSVRGFSCGPAWTITLALQIAEDGFDDGVNLQRSWPLATIWADDANYIRLIADTATGSLQAALTLRGREVLTLTGRPTSWQRGSPVLVSLSLPGGDQPLEMTLSAGGQDMHTVVGGTVRPVAAAFTPRELRFFGPGPRSSLGIGSAVGTITVWGGQIDENRALDDRQRRDLLTSLRFLDLPLP
jgi:hypothetical protein